MSSATALAVELQPTDWDTIDDALYDWLNVALAMDNRIIWEQLNEPQPAYPYLSLLRSTGIDEGGADEERTETVDANDEPIPAGDTVTVAVRNRTINYQPVTFTFTIQAHVDLDEGARSASTNAVALLSKAKRSLGKQTVIDVLQVARLAVVEKLNVLDTSVKVNGEWISRASLDVIFRTSSATSEFVDFIEQVQLVSTDLGIDRIVDAS